MTVVDHPRLPPLTDIMVTSHRRAVWYYRAGVVRRSDIRLAEALGRVLGRLDMAEVIPVMRARSVHPAGRGITCSGCHYQSSGQFDRPAIRPM